MTTTYSPTLPGPPVDGGGTIEGKAVSILRDCVYRIATGKWKAGERLPSIRQAEADFGVNRLTVQKAYRRLAEMGLAESRPRSGYYVAGGGSAARVAEHRHELARLHRRVARLVREETGFSALGVLRYLAQLEEMQRREEPEAAFVECTVTQAEGHAAEITGRLGAPVRPLTTTEIAGRRNRIPAAVRTLLTSPFHLDELLPLADPPQLGVAAVPIEVSPAIAHDLAAGDGELVLLETEEEMGVHIAEDVSRVLGGAEVSLVLVDGAAGALNRRPPGAVTFLSPRLWGSLTPADRAHPRIRQAAFRIRDDAWPQVADALGLPLGIGV